jgi:hypothetical protein
MMRKDYIHEQTRVFLRIVPPKQGEMPSHGYQNDYKAWNYYNK